MEERNRAIIDLVRSETELLINDVEAEALLNATSRCTKIPTGDFAEVGVYKGGSAMLMCEVKGNRPLHLFDTFTGIPKVSDDDIVFTEGQYPSSYYYVRNLLSKYSNVHIHRGVAPISFEPILYTRFAFVHLDVDVYWSVMDTLSFFYPRLVNDGVILLHDAGARGVDEAVSHILTLPATSRIQNTAYLTLSRGVSR